MEGSDFRRLEKLKLYKNKSLGHPYVHDKDLQLQIPTSPLTYMDDLDVLMAEADRTYDSWRKIKQKLRLTLTQRP